MRLWRDSLRMQRRAGHDVEVLIVAIADKSLAVEFSRGVGSSRGFRVMCGQLRDHFTPSAAGGQHKRGSCAERGSLLTGGENTEGPTGA